MSVFSDAGIIDIEALITIISKYNIILPSITFHGGNMFRAGVTLQSHDYFAV